jgi:hypothetical protein
LTTRQTWSRIFQHRRPVHFAADRVVQLRHVVHQALLHLLQQVVQVQHHPRLNGDVVVPDVGLVGIDVDVETVLDGVDEVGVFQVPHGAFQLGDILGNAYFFQGQGVQVF